MNILRMVFKQERFCVDFGEISDSVLDDSYKHMTDHPLYLFLPATMEDAQNDLVMGNIISVLKTIQEKDACIDNIVLGLDTAKEKSDFEKIKEKFKTVPNAKVIWNDSPEIKELYSEFKEQGLPTNPGKGRNMWTGLGYRYMTDRVSSFVIHDCDIKPEYYSDRFIMSLITPILNPAFGEQDFTKAYYTRITPDGDKFKLGGRTTRLLVYPFLDALHENYGGDKKIILDYLDHMKSFKYPLSGEFAMRANLANSLTIQPDWGLEVGSLNSLFQTRYNLSQVNLGLYDHKHSPVSADNPSTGLNKMAEEIVKTTFRKLHSLSVVDSLSESDFDKTMYDYRKFASSLISKYKHVSASRGWNYDEAIEVSAKKTFDAAIQRGYKNFLAEPEEIQALPTWNSVSSEKRDRLVDIVDYYNK